MNRLVGLGDDGEFFIEAWKIPEHYGMCDAAGSHEYYRVVNLWMLDKCPAQVKTYIILHTNGKPMN
jgi:hypothetical protein